ncbi:shieldin complex subunit 2 isoform X3 [Sturnira hondurensis]|uniref:shieldin complex subunit 2 isoform X3 n=1 Tax=Sturnira hondurensis TaxID=192404 RepID=UPI00187A37A0|nr:shieldin complex subunit 2 isoform X3 [Sturnira hondurensis]
MSRGSEVHIFWGAPVGPLKMTVSQEPTSLMSSANPWEKIQLLYNQHSLHLKNEKCKNENLEDFQVRGTTGPPDLPNEHFSANSMNRSVHVKDDFIYCVCETQTLKFQKSHPLRMSDKTNSDVQLCACKGRVQHLTEEKKYQKLFSENKKITVEQHKDQLTMSANSSVTTHSRICGQNVQKSSFELDHKCAAILDLVCSTEQINIGSGAIDTTCVPTEHQEIQNEWLEKNSSNTVDKPRSEGADLRKASDLKVSTDTEFLSIMTSSQLAFLAQKKYKEGNSINKGMLNMEIGSGASLGEIKITEDNLIQPDDAFVERYESRQNQAYSLEVFSPVFPETRSSHIHINSDKGFEGNMRSQELFNFEDKLPSNEICIESYSSGILCSQINAFHKTSVKRNWISEDKLGHLKVLQTSKKIKLVSNAGDPTTRDQRSVSEFKGIKKTSLIKNCNSKSQKYNCLVMVLSPCHVKEINIKSGPNSGSKVPLATIVIIDQSEIKKKVFLWRTAAFWALTLFLGDIILLTDVIVHEGHWVGETILQSTFTSQLLNLGSYSSVQPEEYSSIVSGVVLQDLLAYVSSKHSYLRDLPQRQPQKMSSIEFVELEQLQPDVLVHAVLRVVDTTVLTEALYSYRGEKQRKVMLTVEQAKGQHYVLVLWGHGAAWYPQLQRKKAPSSEITYGMVAADLFHSLLAGGGAPCVVKVQSLFVLDENSYPLQQDFSLLDFFPDGVKDASYALPCNQMKKLQEL